MRREEADGIILSILNQPCASHGSQLKEIKTKKGVKFEAPTNWMQYVFYGTHLDGNENLMDDKCSPQWHPMPIHRMFKDGTSFFFYGGSRVEKGGSLKIRPKK